MSIFGDNQTVQMAERMLVQMHKDETISKEEKEITQNRTLNRLLEQERETATQVGSYLQERSYNALLLNALPPLPQNAAAAPGHTNEANLGRKKRKELEKKRKEEYEKLGKSQQLLDYNDIKNLPLLQTKESREKWENAKLKHSNLTRGETIRMVSNGDYSNFENLDGVMRSMFAKESLTRMLQKFDLGNPQQMAAHTPEEICMGIKQEGGVSSLLDPTLRLGLSLAQKQNGIYDDNQKEWFRKLDEQMSAAVMLETLTHTTNHAELKETLTGKNRRLSDQKADKKAADMIAANKAQQIQTAKRLLLMHLGRFTKVDNNGQSSDWDKPTAVALSHCSRVTLTLPMQKSNTKEDKAAYQRMWNSIFYQKDKSNPARDKRRGSSTHNLKVKKRDTAVKEKKVVFNFSGQRGMNVAIGGLGSNGISGKTILNDGSCGHFYSMYKKGDTSHYGAMLMGLESDNYGVTNQLGHTHDIKATAEKASSLGGQRTDEVGAKYGGRRCDLSGLTPEQITVYMETLEDAMKHWQNTEAGLSGGDGAFVMEKLVGTPMTQELLGDVLARLERAAAH